MSARWRVFLLFAAIVIAALVFDRFRSGTQVVASVAVQPVIPSTTPRAPVAVIAPAVIETPGAAAVPSINPALVKGFSTSTNYRAFIAFAKADVAHGGGAYAIEAEGECDYVKMELDAVNRGAKEASPDTRDIVARAEARTLLEARCGTLMQNEVGGRTFFELRRSGQDGSDPLLRLRDQFHDPRLKTDPAYRNAFVARVVETQDPLMWTRYASLLLGVDPIARTASFDGIVQTGNDYEALVAATVLVPCALGFDCARLDTMVAVTCLQYHVCEHDRFGLEKLKAEALGYDFLQVLAFQDAIVTAWKTQRVAAFVKS